ncbi:MAG TPA: hypothetical protein VGM67_14395 [Gemmatimonadaceae bacterium]|jgi:hypothetical protein
MTALRALLAGIVDYAGLFPPAALDMPTAVRNYASYCAEDAAWMLGRFVVPIARLDEFAAAREKIGDDQPEWRLTGIAGADVAADLVRVREFNRAHGGQSSIDSIEAKLGTVDAIRAAAAESAADACSLFAEIPLEPDPAPLVQAIKAVGISAKLRTGGVTPEAIPSPAFVGRALRRCVDAGVRFKATAGLHHPLRAEHPLTYDTGAPVGVMYGYLNVFLSAAFMHEGMSDSDAERLLDERSVAAIQVSDSGIAWERFRLSTDQVRHIRSELAVSFGSCSFREPVDELRDLALLDRDEITERESEN